MSRKRVLGWVVTTSKEEAIKVLQKMLKSMEKCDDDVDMVNMYITREDLEEKA